VRQAIIRRVLGKRSGGQEPPYCAAGKSLQEEGGDSEGDCTDCEAGVISSEGAAECRACDAYAQRVGDALQENCECNIGFYRSSVDVFSACTLCEPGTYKTEVGNEIELCMECPMLSVIENDQMCTPDTTNPEPGPGDGGTGGTGGPSGPGPIIIITPLPLIPFVVCVSGICGCQEGYDRVLGDCTACTFGKYKTTIGSDPCTDCHQFSFSAVAAAEDDSGCVCNAGYQQHSDGATYIYIYIYIYIHIYI